MINYEKELVLSSKIYSIEYIKDVVGDIMKEFEIQEAYLFGSYARREATKNSDIDIMIKKSDSFTLLQLSSLANLLMSRFGKQIDIITQETYTDDIKYDDDEIKKLKQRFYKNIQKEMVKIYG